MCRCARAHTEDALSRSYYDCVDVAAADEDPHNRTRHTDKL